MKKPNIKYVPGELVKYRDSYEPVYNVDAKNVWLSFDGKTLTKVPKSEVRKVSILESLIEFRLKHGQS